MASVEGKAAIFQSQATLNFANRVLPLLCDRQSALFLSYPASVAKCLCRSITVQAWRLAAVSKLNVLFFRQFVSRTPHASSYNY